MNRHFMVIAFFIACLSLPTLVLAQTMEHGPEGQDMEAMEETPSWGITPEQQAKLDTLNSALRERLEPLQRKLVARKLELKAALLADEPEFDRIDALVAEINRINGEIFSRQVDVQVEMSRLGIYGPIMSGPMGMKGGAMGMMGKRGMGMGSMMGGMHGKGKGMGMGMMHGGMSGGSGQGMMGMCPMMQGMKGMGMSGSGQPMTGQPGMLQNQIPEDQGEHLEHHPQQ